MSEFIWQGDNRGGSGGGGGGGGSAYWIDPVANEASLPISSPDGTMVVALDTGTVFQRVAGVWEFFFDASEYGDTIGFLFSSIDSINAILPNKENKSSKGQPNGYASLDGSGLIPPSQLPPIAITDTFIVASQAAQTALTAQVGDVAVRTDLNKSYILQSDPASTFANWVELLTPTDSVLSVNGQTGAVTVNALNRLTGDVLSITAAGSQPSTTSIAAISGNPVTGTTGTNSVVFNQSPTISNPTLTTPTLGTPVSGNLSNTTNIPVNQATGILAIANGGTGASNATTARNNLSPLTSNGDLWYYNAGANTRLPVGPSNGKLTNNLTLFGTGLLGWLNDYTTAEKNYMAVGANSNQGWLVSGAGIAVGTLGANNANAPATFTTSSTLQITRASGTDYAYARFTVDRSDYNKKLKLQKEMSYLGAAGDYTVRVFSNTLSNYTGTSTELTVSPTTSLPGNYVGIAQMSFDAPNATAPYIEVRIYGNVGTTPLYLNNFLVGPGVIGQVPAVGVYQTYTTVPTGFGTVTNLTARYKQNTDEVKVKGVFTTGTPTGVLASITLPNGWTINSNVVGSGNRDLGTFQMDTAGATSRKTGLIVSAGANSNLVYFTINDYTSGASPFTPQNGNSIFGTTVAVEFEFTVPVNELSAGNVNLGAGAQPSYASNSSTSTATDTTSFQYGEDGALVQAFAPAGVANVAKRVRSPYPNPKFVSVQMKPAGRSWITLGDSEYAFTTNGTTSFGANIQAVAASNTDYDIRFYSQATAISGDTWASQSAAGTRWRVVFADTPAAVGFGLATAQDSGLVSREQTTLLSTTVTGATTSPAISARQTRVGRQVNITVSPTGILTKNGTPGTINFTIDPDYRPTATINLIAYASTAAGAVLWQITAAGLVQQTNTGAGGNVAAGGSCGWDQDIALTYSVR